MNPRLGYREDIEDSRDFVMGSGLDKPGSSSLRHLVKAVLDQGKSNSCVLNAMSSGHAMRNVRRGRPWQLFSRRYGYYYARVALGGFGRDDEGNLTDDGCRPRDALRVLSRLGAPPEHLWEFSDEDEDLNERPSHLIRQTAVDLDFTYKRCISLDGIGRALSIGCPVVLGMNIDRAMVENRGPGVIERFSDTRAGGHMVAIVENNAESGTMTILNSWGTAWRSDGFCEITHELLAREMRDVWAIQ